MTDAELLQLADKPDWWMGPDRRQDQMRTLRQAVALAERYGERAFLFRAGGFGAAAIWLSASDVSRLNTLLAREACAA